MRTWLPKPNNAAANSSVDVDLGRTLRAVWRTGARPAGPAADLLGFAVRRLRSRTATAAVRQT